MDLKQLVTFLRSEHDFVVSTWKTAGIVSISVFLVLLVFQPWGLNTIHVPFKYVVLGGYAALSCAVCLLNLLVGHEIVIRTGIKWTITRNVIFLLWMVLSIAFSNVLYTYWSLLGAGLDSRFLLSIVWYTMLVAMVPVVLLTFLNRNISLKKHEKEACKFNEALDFMHPTRSVVHETIKIVDKQRNDYLELDAGNILYVEKQGKLVNIHHTQDGKLLCKTMNCKLKTIDEQLHHHRQFRRCHRMFIVNTSHIVSASGNEHGYVLYLDDCDTEIQVSRTYIERLNYIFEH